MLFVVLLLLLTAVGLLVMSFVTSATGWAWASIAVSGLAAVVLIARWWRARRRRAAASGRHRIPKTATRKAAAGAPDAIPGIEEPVFGDGAGVVTPPGGGVPLEGTEPLEEETDAADLLVVCELQDEVLVADEHPRYHLVGCGWLESRTVEPLPVTEARSLGFTPCAQCGPDAELANRHRRSRAG